MNPFVIHANAMDYAREIDPYDWSYILPLSGMVSKAKSKSIEIYKVDNNLTKCTQC